MRAVRVGDREVPFTARNGHIVVAPDVTRAGENAIAVEFVAGDEALNRGDDFLYTLFVPARAQLAFPCFDQPDLKARYTLTLTVPASWQVAANAARGCGAARRRAWQPSRAGSPRRSRCPPICSRLPPAASRWRPPRAAAARCGCCTARPTPRRWRATATPIFDLHAAGAGLAGGLHRHSVPVRQVRLRADPVVPVRRHGARRRDLLQRGGPDARRVGHAEPAARARQRDRPRDRAHVVRRPGDDALVQRRVDQGGLRQLHGGEDREPVVSAGEPRAALPAGSLSGRVSGGSHGRHQRRPPDAGQPERRRPDVRPDHLRQGAGRDAAAGADGGRDGLPRRHARVPAALRVRQRDVARAGRDPRRAHAARPGGVEPRLGGRARAPGVRARRCVSTHRAACRT